MATVKGGDCFSTPKPVFQHFNPESQPISPILSIKSEDKASERGFGGLFSFGAPTERGHVDGKVSDILRALEVPEEI